MLDVSIVAGRLGRLGFAVPVRDFDLERRRQAAASQLVQLVQVSAYVAWHLARCSEAAHLDNLGVLAPVLDGSSRDFLQKDSRNEPEGLLFS